MTRSDSFRQTAIDWPGARRLSFEAASILPAQSVTIEDAVGRILARDVRALYDLPHYSSSAMDGWAVAGEAPWEIVATEVAPASSLLPGQAAAVVTGGLIPPGTRGVLRSENATVSDHDLIPRFLRRAATAAADEPREGKHIRLTGEEAAREDVVIDAGTLLNPAHVALAAMAGHDRLDVVREPTVALLFTGDEVVESGTPLPGQVRDSFGPQLPAFVRLLGGRIASRQRIGDDRAATLAALGHTNSDVIITTGGTGDSPADHIRAALFELGAELVIDRVAMRPGSPSLLARLTDGRFVICLPGNPLAAMMGMLTLAEPLLAALAGRPQSETGSVAVADDIAGRAGTTMLVPYRILGGRIGGRPGGREGGLAVANEWQGSGMMRGLADANGVLIVPEDGVRAGEVAEVLGLPWRV